MEKPIYNFILDILFPKFCINCGLEKDYLCYDCFFLIEILEKQHCPFCNKPNSKTCPECKKTKSLDGLFCAASYDNFIVKKIISQFKYEPFIKDLAKTISFLIIIHLLRSNRINSFSGFFLAPVPLYKSKIRRRGFNQSEEIAKELSKILNIPVLKSALKRIKNTAPQVNLDKEKRQENIKGAFLCTDNVKDKKMLLVDDVFTTGSTMEECAKILKENRAKEVWGITLAKG